MTIRENTDAELTRSQLKSLKDLLLDKRRELNDTLDVLNRQIVAKEDCSLTDAVEAASQREVVSRASGLADMHNQTIAVLSSSSLPGQLQILSLLKTRSLIRLPASVYMFYAAARV